MNVTEGFKMTNHSKPD